MVIWTAGILGLLGSLHCVGMCGAIALALPGNQAHMGRFLRGRMLYNLGRTTTYLFLGGLIGLFGQSLGFAGWQQGLSLVLGTGLILGLLLARPEALVAFPPMQRGLHKLRQRMGQLLQYDGPSRLYQLGILNGLLPCGFVYLALAGAAIQPGMEMSMAYMGVFGLATIPAMFSLSLLGRWTPLPKGFSSHRLWQGLALVFAMMLIVRGLGWGIPWLSPVWDLGAAAACGP